MANGMMKVIGCRERRNKIEEVHGIMVNDRRVIIYSKIKDGEIHSLSLRRFRVIFGP